MLGIFLSNQNRVVGHTEPRPHHLPVKIWRVSSMLTEWTKSSLLHNKQTKKIEDAFYLFHLRVKLVYNTYIIILIINIKCLVTFPPIDNFPKGL